MEKRVDHLCLQLGRDAADHAKVKKGQPPVGHYQQIARMRIGVKKAVLQQLFEIGFDQQPIYLFRRDAEPLLFSRSVTFVPWINSIVSTFDVVAFQKIFGT